MSKKTPRANPESVALYEAVLATVPKIERKGATMPYTSVNGNMFSLLTPEGILALRLPSPDREAFLKDHKTTLCKQYGVVMKEYVCVPSSLLKNTRQLSRYLKVSYQYACALRAKPTTRKTSAKSANKAPRSRQSSQK